MRENRDNVGSRDQGLPSGDADCAGDADYLAFWYHTVYFRVHAIRQIDIRLVLRPSIRQQHLILNQLK